MKNMNITNTPYNGYLSSDKKKDYISTLEKEAQECNQKLDIRLNELESLISFKAPHICDELLEILEDIKSLQGKVTYNDLLIFAQQKNLITELQKEMLNLKHQKGGN